MKEVKHFEKSLKQENESRRYKANEQSSNIKAS